MRKKMSAIFRGYKVLNSLIPRYLPVAAIRALFDAALPLVNLIASAMIVNALAEKQPLDRVILLAIWAAGINLFTQIIMHLLKRIMSYLSANIW